MSQQWFIVRGGREHGPFSPKQLKAFADQGKLKPIDQLRREDRSKLDLAGDFKGLFGPLRPTSSPKTESEPATSGSPPQAPKAAFGTQRVPNSISLLVGCLLPSVICFLICCGAFFNPDAARLKDNPAYQLMRKGESATPKSVVPKVSSGATNTVMKKLLSQKGFRPQPMPPEQYQEIMAEVGALHADDFKFTIIGQEQGRKIAERFKNLNPHTLFTAQEVAALQIPIGGKGINPDSGTFTDNKGSEQKLPMPMICWSQLNDIKEASSFSGGAQVRFYVSESGIRFHESKRLHVCDSGSDNAPECSLRSLEFIAADGMAVELKCSGIRIVSVVCKIMGKSGFASVPDHVRTYDSERNEYRREVVFKSRYIMDDDRRLLKIEYEPDGTYKLSH